MADITAILDRWQTEADAATKGPWEEDGDGVFAPHLNDAVACCMSRSRDVAFVAHARTAVPRLIAALRLACNSGLPTEVWAKMTETLEGQDG